MKCWVHISPVTSGTKISSYSSSKLQTSAAKLDSLSLPVFFYERGSDPRDDVLHVRLMSVLFPSVESVVKLTQDKREF